jgi:serine/threonine protein kinase
VTKEGLAKIADFGLARVYGFTTALTSIVVTLWYRSPEVLLSTPYSSSVDMWSIGCIMAELCLRRPLFCGHSDVDQLYRIFEIMGLPKESDWPAQSAIPRNSFLNDLKPQIGIDNAIKNIDNLGKNLLSRLLDYNIFTRITARDALLHDFFMKQDKNKDDSKEQGTSTLTSTSATPLPDITNFYQPNILKRKRNSHQ